MDFRLTGLPVIGVLDKIGLALEQGKSAILSAPPGAGKTTIVPLYLLDAPWRDNRKIIVLEPRRLAARSSANRMAALLGEPIGQTIGYRMRLDNRISAQTRIEVVTEGVFARMILDDPELKGIACVIFDEFHERSLDGDFGLALALDVQSALREDLKILVMSATLDVDRVSALLGHPAMIESFGRVFGVDVQYKDRPAHERIEETMARQIQATLAGEQGSILAFLPGQAEILRTVERLEGLIDADIILAPLYGNLPQAAQEAAIRPAPIGKRKVVLATSIAETSITIDGVRIVIDSGLQRLPVFEPATGITRLETQRVSRASADQRAGRAGRTAPGIAIRLWHPGQTAALAAFTPPQILSTDLTGLMLDLAYWGVSGPQALSFIDLPSQASIVEAKLLLNTLGAVDDKGALTDQGRKMRDLALPPRLAAMVIAASTTGHQKDAALLAVLLTEQGLGGSSLDLEERLSQFRHERGDRAENARRLAEKIARSVDTATKPSEPAHVGTLLLHAFVDRVAFQRGGRGRFVMANGRGAEIAPTERLAGSPMLVIADLTGRAGGQRVLAAADITRSILEAELPTAICQENQTYFDEASGQVRARRITRLRAIILEEAPLARPKGPAVAQALGKAIRHQGPNILPFSKAGDQLRDRIGFLHRRMGEPWPDVSDEALVQRLEEWFIPFQGEITSLSAISPQSLAEGLMALIPHDLRRDLEKYAPTHFKAPTGNRHPIDYEGGEPLLVIRVQELFGLKAHPVIGGGKIPLLLELTSPAHRPIQTTRDLVGFWNGSWKDVRSEMRGRYPRHPWPEDPAMAAPTTRIKPRGT